MSKGLVIGSIIFIALAGAIAYFYLYVQSPYDDQETVNISVMAVDDSTGKYVKTGYKVFSNNTFLSEGETSNKGPILVKALNQTNITIYNINLEDQDYYVSAVSKYIQSNLPQRVILHLTSPGDLEIETFGSIDNPISMKILSKGEFRYPLICLNWDSSVIYVKLLNATQVDSVENKDKCYSYETLYKDDELQVVLDYRTFGNTDDAFINVSFYDGDKMSYTQVKTSALREVVTIY